MSNMEGHVHRNLDCLIPSLVRIASKFINKSLEVYILGPFIFTINISRQEVSYAPHIFCNWSRSTVLLKIYYQIRYSLGIKISGSLKMLSEFTIVVSRQLNIHGTGIRI